MRKGKEAFTLIELIIATSILAFLMASIYSLFYKNSFVWKVESAKIQMGQNARVCLDMMAREIRTAFLSSTNPHLTFKGKRDRLDYVCASNRINKAKEYDLCKVSYSLSGANLCRWVKAIPASTSESGGSCSVLALNISSLSFMYYDGAKWRKSWDSTMGTPEDMSDDSLPLAVKITITTYDEENRIGPLTLSTVVIIPQENK